jgi:hypothetical protein
MSGAVHPALERARDARRQGELSIAPPSLLYGLAEGDVELYRHAMIEAGLLLDKEQVGDDPKDPCPICGWSLKEERGEAAEADDEENSVHDAIADALERELVEFTGQQSWERSKIDAAAARIGLAAHQVEARIAEAETARVWGLEGDSDGV